MKVLIDINIYGEARHNKEKYLLFVHIFVILLLCTISTHELFEHFNYCAHVSKVFL